MQTIQRGAFELVFVDPVADRHLLGDRYCWGGYLWQLRDGMGRELLSGPEYPEPSPRPFNGQGLPEVFRSWDKQSGELLNIDENGEGLVLGVGQVRVVEGRKLEVVRPCVWEILEEASGVVYRTRDAHGERAYELERRWTVDGHTLISATQVRSRGRATLDVHWYPHPFFPVTPGGTRFSVTPDVTMAGEHAGYTRDGRGWKTTAACDNNNGCFEWLHAVYGPQLRWTVAHPLCHHVTVVGDFTTAYMPVWCNANTISLEPHVVHALEEGEAAGWAQSYTFGH